MNSDQVRIDFEEVKRADSADRLDYSANDPISELKKAQNESVNLGQRASPLAPLMADVPPSDFKMMSEIDIGAQNYTLKCIYGRYVDKFKYIPTSKVGLIIGSDTEIGQIDSSKRYWKFYESDFANEHCHIVYKPDYMVY